MHRLPRMSLLHVDATGSWSHAMSALSVSPNDGVRYVAGIRVLQTADIGAGVAVAAWYPGHWLAVLLVLPWVWSQSYTKPRAFAVWVGYYLVVSRDIPSMCAKFFADTHEATRLEAYVF